MKRIKKLLALFLSFMIALNLAPNMALVHAETEETEEVVFVNEPEQKSYRVEKGTTLGEVGLPATVSSVVVHSTDGEETAREDRSIGVEWQGEYHPEEVGLYSLTASFVEEIATASDVVMPTVEVEVLDSVAVEEAGEPAGEVLPESEGEPSSEEILSEEILSEEMPSEENAEEAVESENSGESEELAEEPMVLGNAPVLAANEGDDEEFNILDYRPDSSAMMDWPGYAEFKAFYDAMPSMEEVDGYPVGSEAFDQLVEDMETARQLAQVVVDFVKGMQDKDALMEASDARLNEMREYYEEQGKTITEEEFQQYREQAAREVEFILEAWKRCETEVVPEEILNPMEKRFEQYAWYMRRTDTTDTVVKNNLAEISIPAGANALMNSEADFGVGKKGLETFTVAISVDFNGFTNVEGLTDKAAIFTLPKGLSFSADSFTVSSTGEEYEFTPKGNGKQELSILFPDAFNGKYYQTFLVTQNVQDLINDLQNSKGDLTFGLDVYTGYRTDAQKHVLSEEDKDHSADMVFHVDGSTPELSISIKKGNIEDIYYPETFTDGRRNWHSGSYETRYADEYLYLVEVKKSEGYLSDAFNIQYNLPGLEENLFTLYFSPNYRIIFTPEGEEKSYTIKGDYDRLDTMLEDYSTDIPLAGISNKRDSQSSFEESEWNSGMTYAELLHKAGTIRIELNASAYISKLYSGDWSKTCYSSGKNIELNYMNYGTGTITKVESASPLYFNFQNGDPITGVYASLRGLQSEMPQYGRNPAYEDSDWIGVADLLQEDYYSDKGFAFYDDLSLKVDFTQELSPVAMQDMETSRDRGISYRFYITDALSGNVVSIETVLAEEEIATYTPKTIDGVVETVINEDYIHNWTLSGADDPDNTRYVSTIEAFDEEFEYSYIFAANRVGEIKLRARHALLSDNNVDIPDNYQAKIKMTLSASDPEILFENEFTVVLRHLQDTITMIENRDCANYLMEVNTHASGSRAFSYSVVKYADTMKYNTNASGQDIQYGEDGYDPIVIELSGDAVTVTDRLESEGQRILGVWGNDGTYYDLGENGINADDHLYVQPESWIFIEEIDHEYYFTGSNHNNNNDVYDTPSVYDLAAIYEELGIDYAEKLVVALTNVNDVNVEPGSDSVTIKYSAGIHKVAPGYLNYDNVIGIQDENDADVKLSGVAQLYCKYSDYLRSKRDGEAFVDSNDPANVSHGPTAGKNFAATSITYGSYSSEIKYVDETDKYVNPLAGSVYSSFKPEYMETVQFRMAPHDQNVPAIDYSEVTYDLSGTDERLLSLTNVVVLNITSSLSYRYDHFNVVMEYTLSDGRSIKTEFRYAYNYDSGRVVCYIPELFEGKESTPKDLSELYLTSLKITFVDGIDWGRHRGNDYYNAQLPGVGLGIKGTAIPEYYPSDPTQKVGTMAHDDEKGLDYDNLFAKVAVSFKDCMGNELADGTGAYAAEGLSKRIGLPRIYATSFDSPIKYRTSENKIQDYVYQNETVDVRTIPSILVQDSSASSKNDSEGVYSLRKLLESNGIEFKPTFYYEIDKGFAYVPDSFYMTKVWEQDERAETAVQVRYIDSYYDDGKGLLIVSYDQAGDETFIYDDWAREFHFQLRAKYDATIGDTRPITGGWADVPFNRNLDQSYDTTGQIAHVDTKYTEPGAPYGDVVGNVGKIAANENGEYEMLRIEDRGTTFPQVSVQEKVFTGMLNYVKAYAPEAEDAQSVSSKDILLEENLFGYKTILASEPDQKTQNWELFVLVPKKDKTFSYYDADANKAISETSDFTLNFNGVDTTKLEEERVEYKLYYTTDENPAVDGYTSMTTECTWHELTGDVPEKDITAVKLWVKELASKQKIALEVKFALDEHKKELGTKTSYIMSYVNYEKVSNRMRASATLVSENGYSDHTPKEYHLEDMTVRGTVWVDKDFDSTFYNGTDLVLGGVEMKVLNENGEELAQPAKVVSLEDGTYALQIPHDGDWQFESIIPEGYGIVNKNKNNNAVLDSAFNKDTLKTDLITFVSDYRTMKFTLDNVNLGLHKLPTLNVPEVVEIPVGAREAGEFEVTVEDRKPGTVSSITLKDGENQEITKVYDRQNDTAVFDGNKPGTVTGKVTIEDGYGGFVQKEYKVIVYLGVTYHIENLNTNDAASKTSGTAPVDVNHYYPSEVAATNVAVIKGGNGFSSSGYDFIGWATSEDDARNGVVTYKAGDRYAFNDAAEGLSLYAVYKKRPSTPNTPAKNDPKPTPEVEQPYTPQTGTTTVRRPYTPNTADTSTVPWLVLMTSSIAMALLLYSVMNRRKRA